METNDLIAGMRLLEKDHSPNGWPAVRMQDITHLCDRIAVLEAQNKKLRIAAETPVTVKAAGAQEDQAIRALISAVSSINRGRQHEVRISGDAEPCYWQRKAWIDWMLDLADEAKAAMVKSPAIMSAPVVVPSEEVRFRVVQLGQGMRRLDWLNDDWWSGIPAGDYRATFQPKALVEQQAAGDKAAELAPQINHVISGLKEQMKIDAGHPVSTAG